jgi:hypothetical protein
MLFRIYPSFTAIRRCTKSHWPGGRRRVIRILSACLVSPRWRNVAPSLDGSLASRITAMVVVRAFPGVRGRGSETTFEDPLGPSDRDVDSDARTSDERALPFFLGVHAVYTHSGCGVCPPLPSVQDTVRPSAARHDQRPEYPLSGPGPGPHCLILISLRCRVTSSSRPRKLRMRIRM